MRGVPVGACVKPAPQAEERLDLSGEGQQPEEKQQSGKHPESVEADGVDGSKPEPGPAGEEAGVRDGLGTRGVTGAGRVHWENAPKLASSSSNAPGGGGAFIAS